MIRRLKLLTRKATMRILIICIVLIVLVAVGIMNQKFVGYGGMGPWPRNPSNVLLMAYLSFPTQGPAWQRAYDQIYEKVQTDQSVAQWLDSALADDSLGLLWTHLDAIKNGLAEADVRNRVKDTLADPTMRPQFYLPLRCRVQFLKYRLSWEETDVFLQLFAEIRNSPDLTSIVDDLFRSKIDPPKDSKYLTTIINASEDDDEAVRSTARTALSRFFANVK